MAQMITMEDGLQILKRAFPKDKKLFNAAPMLCNVFTGCGKTIRFCLVAYVNDAYYVREMLSGRIYKTTCLHYCEMEAGVRAENLTVVEHEGKLAVRIMEDLNA